MTDSLPDHLRLECDPAAHPDNVVAGEQWRITLIADGLVRLEWSPSGAFEDRASQFALRRTLDPDAPVVDHIVRESTGSIELITDRLHLSYDRQPFSPEGLWVQARGGISEHKSLWRFGVEPRGNLGGTARTLDEIDGRLQLEDGILSTYGVAVLDDSDTALLTDDGWFAPREPGSIDLYVFCYGRDYRDALRAYFALSGSAPLVPRFALGNWWSRYHPYTDEEYLGLIDRFGAAGIPYSVAVLDMDWHHVDIDPSLGSGWTGYSWNRDLFPDPPAFLAQLHERGLRVTLNVHPADGIRAHEDCYEDVARALGRDPASELPVLFEPTDPDFLAAYFEHVHHPHERDGVDFWWLDWQQGPHSRIAGLDPLWLLNHLHYLDAGRDGGPIAHRPITFSRYAGPGSHRYPIGFSGDATVTWASLAFQSEFTATASNIGYGWWSHDIGGHMYGGKDDELATRWVQLGAFSPILRLHSTSDPFNSKEPWRFGEQAERVMSRFLRLRHRLLPYLATAAYDAHQDDRLLVEPMYYEHPWDEDAYRVPNQFRFGPSLVVAPVVTPRDPVTLRAATSVWVPPGRWVDLFSGLVYRGGRSIVMHRSLDAVPILAPAGAIVPLATEEAIGNDTGPPAAIQVWLVAGADGRFRLAEDRDDDAWAFTDLGYSHGDGSFRIGPVIGESATVPTGRRFDLVLLGFGHVRGARVGGAALPMNDGPVAGAVRIEVGEVDPASETIVEIDGDRELAARGLAQRVFALLDEAQTAFEHKSRIWESVERNPPAAAALAVGAVGAPASLVGAIQEILLADP